MIILMIILYFTLGVAAIAFFFLGDIKIEKLKMGDILPNFNFLSYAQRPAPPAPTLVSFSVTAPSSGLQTIKQEALPLSFVCGEDKYRPFLIEKFKPGSNDKLLNARDNEKKELQEQVTQLAVRLKEHMKRHQMVGIILIGSADKLPAHNTELANKSYNNNLALMRAEEVSRLLQKSPAKDHLLQPLWFWVINNSIQNVRLLGVEKDVDFDTVRAVHICAAFREVQSEDTTN